MHAFGGRRAAGRSVHRAGSFGRHYETGSRRLSTPPRLLGFREPYLPLATREVQHFFEVYKELEGKPTARLGWHSSARAREIIAAAHQRFRERYGR